MPCSHHKSSSTRNLKQVKAGEAQTEDDIMDNMDSIINAGEIIPKVG